MILLLRLDCCVEMSQCVPSWDVEDNPSTVKINAVAESGSSSLGADDVPS